LGIDNFYEPPQRDKDMEERGVIMYSSPSKKKEQPEIEEAES